MECKYEENKMKKVKFVQVAITISADRRVSEYVDDKGRIWWRGHPSGKFRLIESPDEPETKP